jgi:hypothetical protein
VRQPNLKILIMFFIILFLLLITWLGYQEGVAGDIFQINLVNFGEHMINVRNFIIFFLTLSLALTLKKTFRGIATSFVILWTLSTIGLSEIASISSAIGFAGFSIISQRPKNRISYLKNHEGKYIENFI